MAFFGFGIVVAPVLGPTLGGWLTDTYSWRYAFYINIPVGALAIFLISRYIKDPPYIKHAKVRPFDNLGFGLLAIWSGCLQIVLDKGQEDDWFGAVWIRWTVALLLVSLVWFIVHCWRKNKEAIVDLHVLKNRNFCVGCILIALLGLAIYITITVLPLYYQEVMGYTALTAGLVVGPRGIGSMLGLPIIGYLGNKVDNRILLSLGFTAFGICNLYFANIHTGISPTTLLIPIMATGIALSGVFVPNSTMAVSQLKNDEIGNATGIFNLLRNIGGSIGISIAQTQLERRSAFHQTEIAASAPQTSYWLQQRIAALTAYWNQAPSHTPGQTGAWGTVYHQLLQQALLWAFVDVFRWTALLCFFSAAIVWFFQKVDPHKAQGAGVH
jgi:DHA2 family multidrug resistance protein